MFYLRRISDSGQETNQKIGSIYTIVKEGSADFQKIFNDIMAHEDVAIFILAPECNPDVICIDVGEAAYIMTENGKTFSNISPANLINE